MRVRCCIAVCAVLCECVCDVVCNAVHGAMCVSAVCAMLYVCNAVRSGVLLCVWCCVRIGVCGAECGTAGGLGVGACWGIAGARGVGYTVHFMVLAGMWVKIHHAQCVDMHSANKHTNTG